MTKKLILFCFFLLASFIFKSEAQMTMGRSMKFMRFANSLPIPTVRFLKQHECEPTVTPKKQEGSVARWSYVTLRCRDLSQNQITAVQCNKMCMDPINCKKLWWLKAVPVVQTQEISLPMNRTESVDIPVACKCIPRNSLSRPCSDQM